MQTGWQGRLATARRVGALTSLGLTSVSVGPLVFLTNRKGFQFYGILRASTVGRDAQNTSFTGLLLFITASGTALGAGIILVSEED